MRTVYGLDNLERPANPVVLAIGNFDGVHLGHQSIMRHVTNLAKSNGFLPAVMTFECHPLKVLAPKMAPATLMPIDRRIEIMESLGIELVVVCRCTHSLLDLSRDEFVENVLMQLFDLKYVVEGPNFKFGRDRSGDINYLIDVGPQFGFQAIKIDPVQLDLDNHGIKTISSSLVRKLVAAGQVDLARKCLGRPYQIAGKVITGAQRGRTIGFPTANLEIPDQLLPEHGIYATCAEVNNRFHPAAVVIGPAPTFEQYKTAIEAFLLDYSGDLYGKNVAIHFYRRLRDIIKFDDPSELVRQIDEDVRIVRNIIHLEGSA
jgi:riboflavin kinase/FMN adenylyltransferase